MRVAVIGGGPSGLVTLKYLLEAHTFLQVEPIEAILFESEEDIGGTFRYRTYEDAELVSSRQLTLFSDFRVDDNAPDFLSTEAYCQYLKRYCDHFQLWPHIRTGSRVDRVTRNLKNSGHIVHYQTTESMQSHHWSCDAIAVCSGLHVTPNMPHIPGIENVPKVIHSSEFKLKSDFGEQKDVLILGAGETAMDLAHLAVTSNTRSVVLSHKSGWQNAPKRLPDPIVNGDYAQWKETQDKYGPQPPTDCSFASLFDTAYLHPLLNRSSLLWDYYTALTCRSSRLLSGTTWGLAQWVGELDESRRHGSKIIPNKSNNAMPYINVPYQPDHIPSNSYLPNRVLALPSVDTGGRQIELAPFPAKIDRAGQVFFRKTDRPESSRMERIVCKPDMIIFATGYTQTFPFLSTDAGYPLPVDADVRSIWAAAQPDVGFIGFVRPNFGAIPPLAELQAQLWIAQLLDRLHTPLQHDETYKLPLGPDRRIQYAVDHDSYAYRLALDLGSAPSVFQVAMFGPTVFATWALGPNFGTKFRLIGPWKKTDLAVEILKTELWRVIARRRSWFVWTFFSIVPKFMFGGLSALLYVLLLPVELIAWMGG